MAATVLISPALGPLGSCTRRRRPDTPRVRPGTCRPTRRTLRHRRWCGAKMAASCVANDRCRPRHFITNPIEHAALDAGHGRLKPRHLIFMDDNSPREISVDAHPSSLRWPNPAAAEFARRCKKRRLQGVDDVCDSADHFHFFLCKAKHRRDVWDFE